MIQDLFEQLANADQCVKAYDQQIQQIANDNPLCQQLMRQRGVGPVTASAFVASVGHPRVFKNGRHVSAWLGLVPKHVSSGTRCHLQGISKRGDRYLRTLLIHGGRAVVRYAKHKTDPLSVWLNQIAQQRGTNVAAVALANKNARQLWAIMAAAC